MFIPFTNCLNANENKKSLFQADVLVCSTNATLDLIGKAGSDLVKGAGQGLVQEIKSKYTGGIKHGEVAVLQGHGLNCQQVFLAALPSWRTGVEQVCTLNIFI